MSTNDRATRKEGSSGQSLPIAERDWHDSYIADLVFDTSEFPVWFPRELNQNQRWMGVLPDAKNPFAPCGEQSPPHECTNAECPAERADSQLCECDGRFKWGYTGHYVTGRDIGLAVGTAQIRGRSYIFSEDDPYLFIDLDDVRCPVTGRVHPVAIAFLAHLGPTWIEVSQSGTGLHAVYFGELPGDLVEPDPVIDDEPWGANEKKPQIEFYSSTTVGVLTGKTVPGATQEVRECDQDALRSILDATGYLTPTTSPGLPESPTLNPPGNDDFSCSDTVTDDVTTVFNALDAIDARRVAEETIVREWIDPPGQECRAFVPTWAPSGYNGTAVYCTENGFTDSGKRGGRGGPVIMMAIALGIISDRGAEPGEVSGRDFFRCIEQLRKHGFDLPQYVPDGDTTTLYLNVLSDFAPGDTDPFENPESCLIACLEARQNGAVPEEAEPPTLALHPIIKYVSGVEPDAAVIDDGTRALARDVFTDLTVEAACNQLGLEVLDEAVREGRDG